MLVVNRFAGVLLQMQPLDADVDRFAIGVDLNFAFAHDGLLELADLITLRQIGIEIVFAIKNTFEIDLRFESESGANGLRDAFLVDDGQHAGHRGIHQRHVRIGFSTKTGRRTRKQLRVRRDLSVDFEPDDHLPVACGAGDEKGGLLCSGSLCGGHRGSFVSLPLVIPPARCLQPQLSPREPGHGPGALAAKARRFLHAPPVTEIEQFGVAVPVQ